MADLKKSNGMWVKVAMCIMAAVSLASVGWGSASTVAWASYRKMDMQGTEKSHDLEVRVAVLEKELANRLDAIEKGIRGLGDDFRAHTRATTPRPGN